MDLLKRLTIKSLILNKKRTIVTIIGIILSIALITAVSSMYFSAINSLIKFETTQKGNYHVRFKNVDIKELDSFEKNKDIDKLYITQDEGYSILENSKNEYKPYAFIKSFTKNSMENLGVKLIEGRLPANENEIIIPTHLKTNGRIKLGIGEEITLNIGKRVNNKGYELTQDDAYCPEDKISEGDYIKTSESEISEGDYIKTSESEISEGDYIKTSESEISEDDYIKTSEDKIIEDNYIKTSQEKIINTINRKFKIVGICERLSSEIECYSAPGYTFITLLDEENITGKIDVFARYTKFGLKEETRVTSNILGIDEKIYKNIMYGYKEDKIVTSDKLEEDQKEFDKAKYKIDTNGYLIGLESNPFSKDGGLIGVAGICCGIIIVTSVFCIKNSFDISITEKIKQYGILRSMGATKKQVKKTVYFEAFSLGIIGIPLGILFGFLASYILIIISNKLLMNSFTQGLKLIFTFSCEATVIAILLGILTIWLSSIRSARKASKITPILAIRNSGDIKIKAKKLKTPKIISKIFGIGGEISYKNLKRNKKKYRTISISIIVVVSVFIAIYYFSNLVFESVKSEFKIQEYNIMVGLNYKEAKEDVSDILKLENINKVSAIKNSQIEILNAKYCKEYLDYIENRASLPEYDIQDTCNIISLDNNSYKEYVKKLGLKYNDVKDKAILYNVTNTVVENDKGKMQLNKTKIYDYTSEDKMDFKFVITNKEHNLELVKITDEYPFGWYSGVATLIVNEEVFDKFEEDKSIVTQIFIDSSNADKLQDDIEKLLGNEKKYFINNIAENVKTMQNMFILIAIFVYGFIIVISLIGVTNIFNTITTSMELRRSEFASLRSIGMTDKEFTRMIRLESMFLGCRSLIIGLPIGIGLSYLINYYFVQNLGELIKYKLPVLAILISSFVVFLLITIIMKYSLGKIKKQNIIETIRNENI